MTDGVTAGGGWDDLVATFAGARLAVPPVPASLHDRLVRRDKWLWSTSEIDRAEIYDPARLIEDAGLPVDDYVAIGHAGHGLNSWFLTYQAVVGPLALFVQLGWGGVYMDADKQAIEARGLFEQIAPLLDVASRQVDPRLRVVVIVSRYKGWDACETIAIDGRSHRHEITREPAGGEISRGPDGDEIPTAFGRAAELLRSSPDPRTPSGP